MYHPLAATPAPARASAQPPVTLQSLKRTEHREVLARHLRSPATDDGTTFYAGLSASPIHQKNRRTTHNRSCQRPHSHRARYTSRRLWSSPALEPIHSGLSVAESSDRTWGCVTQLPSRREPTKTFAAHGAQGGLRHTRGLPRTSNGNDFTRARSTTTLSTPSVTHVHCCCAACTGGRAARPQGLMPTRSARDSAALRYSTSVKAQLTRKSASKAAHPAKAEDPNEA